MMMRRKKRGEQESAYCNLWMISYADMMTTQLVMFIALATLAMDQTGIQLSSAIGSFARSQKTFGLSGWFSGPERDSVSPNYPIGTPDEIIGEGTGTPFPAGPDPITNPDESRLQHFLSEMNRQFPLDKLPRVRGRVIADFYDPLNQKPPFLRDSQRAVLGEVTTRLRRDDYRVMLVCWAPSPQAKEWSAAALRSQALADEIAADFKLDAAARGRIVPVGQPWKFRTINRPIFSLIIIKNEAPGKT